MFLTTSTSSGPSELDNYDNRNLMLLIKSAY